MQSRPIEHCILGFVVLATLVWLELLTAEILRDAAVLFLVWAGFSTLLVASAGAWVAYVRTRQARHPSPHS
jgi:hypothetical protein